VNGDGVLRTVERWQRIESPFEQALQRPRAEREQCLREGCEGDSDVPRDVARSWRTMGAAASRRRLWP
jgi:hypothetical protein